MKETRIMMDMHITVAIADAIPAAGAVEKVFSYFRYVDEKFSIYKDTSEITKINKGALRKSEYSEDMKTVLALCEKTKKETGGYFDIVARNGSYDPSGLVKGWAIHNAAKILTDDGFENFYVDAGGDIQVRGYNAEGNAWRIGIRNPFNPQEIVKVLYMRDGGIATSGTSLRGQHIYNPKNKQTPITEIASITVVGPNIHEADRFATAAFAMGKKGIAFIETLSGFEGYMIAADGMATMTSGFEKYMTEEKSIIKSLKSFKRVSPTIN